MTFEPDIRYPQFGTTLARTASGVDPKTLHNWNDRLGDVLPKVFRDDSARPLYSFADIVRLALMAELTRLGHTPARAAAAAVKFTETGEYGASRRDEEVPLIREFGKLYEAGATVLVLFAPTERPEKDCRVINPVSFDSALSFYDARLNLQNATAVTVLNVDRVWERVETTLGLPRAWMN